MPKISKYKVVLDTNVFVVSLFRHHKFHWIFQRLRRGDFELYITNDILMEYMEIASRFYGWAATEEFMEVLLQYSNVVPVDPYFHWNLIADDPDDNKFVDCAVAVGAHFIVTHDKHFNILRQIKFPDMDVIDVDSFAQILDAVS